MRAWPPYDATGDDTDDPTDGDGIDPAVLAAEVDRLLVALNLAPASTLPDPYAQLAAVQAELAQLGVLRSAHRRSRWVITASRIVAVVFVVAWMWTGSAGYGVAGIGFTLLAVHRAGGSDVSRERGRELDAAIADARERLRGLLGREG